jgi:hypothetical protein
MRDANLIVIRHQHQGDTVIENLLNYMVGSYFADDTEILTNNVRKDTFKHMVEDIYRVQDNLDMNNHRRMFHMVLSTRPSKISQTVLENGAYTLREYFNSIGHQAVFVPHYGSAKNMYNFHYHVAVNPICYIDNTRMIDKFETYNAITDYLNQNTINCWGWKFHNNKPHSDIDGWCDGSI